MKKLVYSLVCLILLGLIPLKAQNKNKHSRSIPQGRVVLPYNLEVSYDKTVHIIMPAPISYVDLGSNNLIAETAQSADNVLRVKASVKDFSPETNLSVICEDGSFYSFNVSYSSEPSMLNIEMQDFISQKGKTQGRLPSNKAEIYFKELGNESPVLVKLLMKTIYENDQRRIKHIGQRAFGMRALLRGLYAHNGLLYFHLRIENETSMPYAVDFISFKVVDKELAQRTAMQEQILQPLRSYHQVALIKGYKSERMILGLKQFSLANDKQLEVSIYERNGGRKLSFFVEHEDLLSAEPITDLKLKW